MYFVTKIEAAGQALEMITLRNQNNMEVKLLNYGATLVELLVPDRAGNVENVVLTYENIEDYIVNAPFFGVTVGRTSGRIAEGCFTLEGQLYKLDKNFGVNHCHGGKQGYSYRFWSYIIQETAEGTAVEFAYKSPEGEENYPGELDAKVTYILREDNTLVIEYRAVTDKVTLCNLTNHSYFNLSGNYKSSVIEQYAWIDAENFLELDVNLIPTGRLVDVKGTPMDFTQVKLIGKDINNEFEQLKITNGYDHPWMLKGMENQIEMVDRESGRKMTVSTTYPSAVIYSFNYPNNERLKYDKIAEKHDGICFETQYEPNGINVEGLNKAILRPGEQYFEKTEFKFSVE